MVSKSIFMIMSVCQLVPFVVSIRKFSSKGNTISTKSDVDEPQDDASLNTKDDTSSCKSFAFAFQSKEDVPSFMQLPSHCARAGWDLRDDVSANCNSTEFPMECTFPTSYVEMPEDMRLALIAYDKEKELPRPSMDADEPEPEENEEKAKTAAYLATMGGEPVKGKYDDLYKWASKLVAKSALDVENCKPATVAKRTPMAGACQMCWKGPIPHPCKCTCKDGWKKRGPLCTQNCSESYPGHDYDSGFHCHKPCDREGQLSLRYGCLGAMFRTCQETKGHCIKTTAVKVFTLVDHLMKLNDAEEADKIKAVNGDSETKTWQDALPGLNASLDKAAADLVNKAKGNPLVAGVLAQSGIDPALVDKILNNGAKLMLAQNVPVDWGKSMSLVADMVDPSGELGKHLKDFTSGRSCDDAVYFNEQPPAAAEGAPDLDVFDQNRIQ